MYAQALVSGYKDSPQNCHDLEIMRGCSSLRYNMGIVATITELDSF